MDPFSDPEWRVWLNNHWRSGARAASLLPAPHLGDILSPVTETSGTEGSAVGRRSGSAGSWWNEDRVMKAWPMASAAPPYVSPNANCPLFKQLFHLDICKCVYKYCLINIALQFVRSESFSAVAQRSKTRFNEHVRTWQQLMESWGTRCKVVTLTNQNEPRVTPHPIKNNQAITGTNEDKPELYPLTFHKWGLLFFTP